MLSRVASTFVRKAPTSTRFAKQVSAPMGTRFYSLEDSPSAKSAWEKSCYFEMDFTIPEDASVFEAVQKFAVSSSGSYYFMNISYIYIYIIFIVFSTEQMMVQVKKTKLIIH